MKFLDNFKSDLTKLSNVSFLAKYLLPVIFIILCGTGINSFLNYKAVDDLTCYEGEINHLSFSTYTTKKKLRRSWHIEKHSRASVFLNTGAHFDVKDEECPKCFYDSGLTEGDFVRFCNETNSNYVLRIEQNGNLLFDWHKAEGESMAKIIFVIVAGIIILYLYFKHRPKKKRK